MRAGMSSCWIGSRVDKYDKYVYVCIHIYIHIVIYISFNEIHPTLVDSVVLDF